MRKLTLAAAVAAVFAAAPAMAQDAGTYGSATTTDTAAPTAPDGTKAFGIVPYVGVMGGWEQFDNEAGTTVPRPLNQNYKLDGALVQGVIGVNVPLGPTFVGVEGNVTKGVSGDIDWEYGAAGRFGLRAGDSGLFYGKVGYQWVNFARYGDNSPDYGDWTYGIGAEIGPKDIGLGGLTNNAGVRLRLEADTYGDFHSFRPMAGVIAHF